MSDEDMGDLLHQFDEIVKDFEKKTDEKLQLERAAQKRKFRQWLLVPILAIVVLIALLIGGILTANALNSTEHHDANANCVARNQERVDTQRAFTTLFTDLNNEFFPPSDRDTPQVKEFEHAFETQVAKQLKTTKCP